MDLTKYYPDIAAKYPAYVTQRELCEICRICPKTAYNLEQQGEIPYTIEQNHLIRSHKIKLTDILAYLYRKANEQLPTGGTLEFSMLEHIISFFVDPYTFEQFACKLVQIMDSNIVSIEQTRRTRDGGRDAVGQYRVGLATGGVELEFALEAKRYSLNNSVGVKETSRLISRIKHRQFGIFVTTSFVGDQAYKEIIEDQHPIVVISGKDIVDILISAGINSVDILNDWLESNFGLH